MGITLAENLLRAIENEAIKSPDSEGDLSARVKLLVGQLDITNRFFAECLWWGIQNHQLSYVVNYFEAKSSLTNNSDDAYRVCVDDYLYFKNGIPVNSPT